jgi:hypothetical protein
MSLDNQPLISTFYMMDAEELLAAVSGASLASSQEHGPPCHQPSMDNDHMEALSQESPTIIPSEPMTLLKAYQMKLVIQKTKNPKEKVQQLIQTMMSMDDKLYIDLCYTHTPETSCVILVLADIPTEDKYFAWYFVDMHDHRNKEYMTLSFRISSEHSHVKWHSLLSVELKALNIRMMEHELGIVDPKVIGFLARKLPKVTHL